MDESDKTALIIAGTGAVVAGLGALTGHLEAGESIFMAAIAAVVGGLSYYQAHRTRTA